MDKDVAGAKYTPGPWVPGYNDHRAILGPKDSDGDDLVIATLCDNSRGLNWHTNCQHSVPTKGVARANAHLIAAAPAQALILEMLCAGVARIEKWEFCFDGIRYSHGNDWNLVLDIIGWDRARAAIKRALGDV